MYQEKLKIDWLPILLWLVIMLFGWVNIYAACYTETHVAYRR